MIEIYEFDGVRYEVSPGKKDEFLNKYPGARLIMQQNNAAISMYGAVGVEEKTKFAEEGFLKNTFLGEAIDFGVDLAEAWDQGWKGTADVGEGYEMLYAGSEVTPEVIEEWMEANIDKVQNYSPSERMKAFQEQYKENGGSYYAFYKGITENPGLLAETLTSSFAGQVRSLFAENPKIARDAFVTGVGGAVTGFKKGGKKDAIKYGIAGGMFGLMTQMEAALTYGDLIREELDKREEDFTQENVYNLITGPDGQKLRNRALGRGLTIGAVETATMGFAGRTTSSLLKKAPGLGQKMIATTAGLSVEAFGGGLGEVLGREVAGQEFDVAEVGFEAFSGLSTAPVSVGMALYNFKGAEYYLNDMNKQVSYNEMKDFVENASDIDIATANIKILNDQTGLGELAQTKQLRGEINSRIDAKITDQDDRNELIDLEIERQSLLRELKKDETYRDVNAKTDKEAVDQKIKTILNKYKGARDFGKTAIARKNYEKITKARLAGTIEFAKVQGARIGKNTIVVEDNAEAQSVSDRLNKALGNKKQNVKGADGFIVGDNIVINKKEAMRTGAVSVGSHELLHGILTNHLKNLFDESQKNYNPNAGKDFGKKFVDILTTRQKEVITKRLKENYGIESLQDEQLYTYRGLQEMFAAFSDGIERGQMTFDEGVFSQIKNFLHEVFRVFGINKEFETARGAYNFLKEYSRNVQTGTLGDRAIALANEKASGSTETLTSRSKAVDFVNEIERSAKQKVEREGREFTQEEFRNPKVFNPIFNAIVKPNGAINNYITSLKLGDRLREEVINEMGDRLMNYDPQAKRKTDSDEPVTVGEAIMANVGFAKLEGKKALAIESERTKQERATDLGETTKEGEVKMQVEDTDTSTMQALEEQDITEQGQKRQEARKAKEEAKRKAPKQSTFRKKLGIEDGSEMYNRILEVAKKTLMKAYDSGKTARQIQRDLRDEAASRIFGFSKQIKDFLGTTKYIQNLKEFRVPIVEAIFTADLVQLEREVADDKKIFLEYVETLTNEKDVVAAINAGLLPESDLARIKKGQSVNLYRKKMPSEEQFIAFFDQPAINPETGKRSGLKGTRKDGLAKYIAGSLNYDATMQASKDPEVQARRELQLAKELGDPKKITEQLIKEDIQDLANAINRDPDLLFSKGKTILFSNETLTKDQQKLVNSGKVIVINTKKQQNVLDELFANNQNQDRLEELVNSTRKLTKDEIKKYGNKFTISLVIDRFNKRQAERIDNQDILNYIRALRKKLKSEVQVHKLYEQFYIDLANRVKGLKNLKIEEIVVKEGKMTADLKFSVGGISYGIEVKMDQSRGGQYTYRFNDITTQKRASANTEDINQTQKLYEKLENELKKIGLTKKDVANGVTEDVKKVLESNTRFFNQSVEVTGEHIEAHYTSKGVKEVFITVGEAGTYYMLPEATLENENLINAIQTIAKDLGIPHIREGKFKLSSILRIGKNPRKTKNNTFDVKVDIMPRLDVKNKTNFPKKSNVKIYKQEDMANLLEAIDKEFSLLSKSKGVTDLTQAIANARTPMLYSKNTRGMSTFDFDETLIDKGENFIMATSPDGNKVKISSAKWPIEGTRYAELGYEFDFTDFVNVRGGVEGPLLQKLRNRIKKFGPKNNYILTARPPESAEAIHEWLKTKDINIPLENITGLGNSTAEAKAMWIAQKFSEGYNDMYFVDDALPNVKAVANILKQLDVKGKSVQTKLLLSKSMDKDFNVILNEVKGVDVNKTFSKKAAAKAGKLKGMLRFFVPPSHEDFLGLLYNFMGTGKQGDKHKEFFKRTLIDPLARAYVELDTQKQAIANGYRSLNKEFESFLTDKAYGDFTFDDAIRVYLWNKVGHTIPGLSKQEIKALSDIVKNDKDLRYYANQIRKISGQKEYVKPDENWDSGNIRLDLADIADGVGRKKIFANFFENADVIFSEKNLNKIEATYGKSVRSAIEDVLYRTKTGRNRPTGSNAMINRFTNFIHGAVGSTMFFNMRSVALQQMSIVNYLNFGDNNVFKAAKAFANQKQYWEDFAYIFNSDMLRQRRGGLQTDVNGAELARDLSGSKIPTRVLIRKLLQLGFKPTQIADNIAIATGGAMFYRNRINRYLKQGFSEKEATDQAWLDFNEITQATQQSARPDKVSQQQASPLGKWILAFQNVTSQYNRLGKKAFLDLVNRRKVDGYDTQWQSDLSSVSRIGWYLGAQSILFYSLQSGLLALMFDDDENDEEQITKREGYVLNGVIDSVLRGTGIYGSIVSTAKNIVQASREEAKKPPNRQNDEAELIAFLNLSPPIGIKARNMVLARKSLKWNKDLIEEMETFDIDNPMWYAYTAYAEVYTNIPVNRIYKKTVNVNDALDSQYTATQRALFFSGWSKWNLNVKDERVEKIKEEIKQRKKKEKKKSKQQFGKPYTPKEYIAK